MVIQRSMEANPGVRVDLPHLGLDLPRHPLRHRVFRAVSHDGSAIADRGLGPLPLGTPSEHRAHHRGSLALRVRSRGPLLSRGTRLPRVGGKAHSFGSRVTPRGYDSGVARFVRDRLGADSADFPARPGTRARLRRSASSHGARTAHAGRVHRSLCRRGRSGQCHELGDRHGGFSKSSRCREARFYRPE